MCVRACVRAGGPEGGCDCECVYLCLFVESVSRLCAYVSRGSKVCGDRSFIRS